MQPNRLLATTASPAPVRSFAGDLVIWFDSLISFIGEKNSFAQWQTAFWLSLNKSYRTIFYLNEEDRVYVPRGFQTFTRPPVSPKTLVQPCPRLPEIAEPLSKPCYTLPITPLCATRKNLGTTLLLKACKNSPQGFPKFAVQGVQKFATRGYTKLPHPLPILYLKPVNFCDV